jgi:hypothetical protein
LENPVTAMHASVNLDRERTPMFKEYQSPVVGSLEHMVFEELVRRDHWMFKEAAARRA